jgi:hypothetical protein
MASTNSFDFVVTRDQIITDAHLHIGAIGEGETPSANQVTEAARMLNMIVKLRAADGMPLWALKRASILPNSSVSSMTNISHVVSFYDSTTISADEAAAQTSISITAAGTIADSDVIGIELDDGTMHWTTVSSGGGTTTVVIASGLPSAAASGNRVYAYTASADRIRRPLRVIEANVKEVSSSSQWSIEVITRNEYYSHGNLTSEGVPNVLYYEPGLGSAVADPTSATTWYGTFYFYPRFSSGDHVIEFTYQRPFADFDAASDHPDFPQEFYLPLTLELAALLGPKFGVPIQERARLFTEAAAYREEALATVAPEGSLRIVPDFR